MKEYEVYRQGGHHYVRGLQNDHGGGDQLLLHHIPFPLTETPEVEDPDGREAMHSALYDLYQWHDGLRSGDTFVTPYGAFLCDGVHVLPLEGQ